MIIGFDNDYDAHSECPNLGPDPLHPTLAIVVSGGPNGINGGETQNYDCDDIYLEIININ